MSPTCPRPWCDLPADLLGHVTARLPFPADLARFGAVCRAWLSAAREHVRRRGGLPWIVLPDASFCTIGHDGVFFDRIPGLPGAGAENNVRCLGAGGAGVWLALDCTDAVHRRTSLLDQILTNTLRLLRRRGGADVKHRHRHTYLLHNPFLNATVALPELDAAFGHVTDEFEIRKVLMMMHDGGGGDVMVAVTTNSYKYAIVVCRPGKGMCVLPNLPILDLAFLGDGTLYAMTVNEDVIALDLTEDSNGRPVLAQYKRVVRRPLADGEEDLGRWMDFDDDDEAESSDDDGEAPDDMEDDDGGYEDSHEGSDEEEDDDGAFNRYGKVPPHTVQEKKKVTDDDEPKDSITTARYLVASSDGKELLMVRHHQQTPPSSGAYTRNIEVFRADVSLREWVPVAGGDGGSGGLTGEALFLSRSYSKSTPAAYGGVEEGLVYFVAPVDDVFDTRCWAPSPRAFSMPWQRKLVEEKLLTWLFPPADRVVGLM